MESPSSRFPSRGIDRRWSHAARSRATRMRSRRLLVQRSRDGSRSGSRTEARMTRAENRPLLEVVGVEPDAPLLLAGSPRGLRASLQLRNATSRPFAIRGAELRLRAQSGSGIEVAGRISLKAAIASGETRATRLRIRVDPDTPPGE